MSIHDDLSRLLGGDLTDEQAEALRQRIRDEPAIGRAWADMLHLVDALAALPDPAPPPGLVDRALAAARAADTATGQVVRLRDHQPSMPSTHDEGRTGRVGGTGAARPNAPSKVAAHGAPDPRRATPPGSVTITRARPPAVVPASIPSGPPPTLGDRVRAGAPWLLAAAAAALLLLRPDPLVVELRAGELQAEGHGTLNVDAWEIDLDGQARILREPAQPAPRDPRRLEDSMNQTHLVAFGAGAVLTIAVQAGTATLRAPDTDPIIVHAGETRTIGGAPSSHAGEADRSEPRLRAAIPSGEAPAMTIARLQSEINALQNELQAARATGAIARGQLELEQGPASPWPADVPPPFHQAALDAQLRQLIADHPGTQLTALDCAEFPCIAVLQPQDATEGWQDRVRPVVDALSKEVGPNDLAINVTAMQDGDKKIGLMGFAIAPEHTLGDGKPVDTRTRWRTDTMLQELGRSALEETP